VSRANEIIHDFISYNIRVSTKFAELLDAGLSSGEIELIRRVAAEAAAASLPVYMVGGIPRDLILGRRGGDFDLVAEGDAIELARSLVAKYGGSLTLHPRFGTAKWDLMGSTLWYDASAADSGRFVFPRYLDLISARGESYSRPGELPNVWKGAIDDDLSRRDFTINTLAVRLDQPHFGSLRDDFGGLDDLEKRQIRVLHENSFRDDPTRIYRAVRYEQRYGFAIAPDTRKLIPLARGLVSGLSAHRIRRELNLILEEERAVRMLRRLAALDLLRPVHKSLPRDKSAVGRLAKMPSTLSAEAPRASRADLGWLLWLMSLTPRAMQSVMRRLQFGNSLAASLIAACQLYGRLTAMEAWKPSRCATYLRSLPLLAVHAVYLASAAGKRRRVLERYLNEWRHARPTVSGHDLRRRGLAPGPAYDYVLANLRDAWIDGLVNNRQQEDQRLESLLARVAQGDVPRRHQSQAGRGRV
jgi:tRNA nucleotidyltransferase (CCA-adding enzyme)